MTNSALKGIVKITIQHADGRVTKEIDENMIVDFTPFFYGLTPVDETPTIQNLGIHDIVYGENGVPPTQLDNLNSIQVILTKTLDQTMFGRYVQTTNMGSLMILFGGKSVLGPTEGNGHTIRELALVYKFLDVDVQDRLFSRIVRSPIVKTADITVTVEWLICTPVEPHVIPSPIIEYIPDDLFP